MNPGRTLQRRFRKANAGRAFRKMRLKPLVISLSAVAGIFGLMLLIPNMALELVGVEQPQLPIVGEGLKIYDRYDRPVCTIYGERDQQLVRLDQVTQFVPEAFIAAEDHDFYRHGGVDPIAIVRAMWVDLTHGHAIQGGSTISQQLIKNLYFEGKKRTLHDKITEAFMAIDVEHRYNKKQILEAYLNYVYFGRGVYGIERASEQYFGKNARKLTVAEAAFLAGLVNAPSDLGRPENKKDAVLRQRMILNSMAELHFITEKELAAAKSQKLVFHTYVNPARKYQQYTAEIVELCQRTFRSQNVYSDGISVYTNMDPAAQEAAERVITNGIKGAPKGINQGALVSINVADGGIIAMVGGVGKNAEWNRATSRHTAGSAFKPFVYLAALGQGSLSPDDMVADAPLEIRQAGAPVYRPKNFDGTYMGEMTIRKAIALSRNTCAVRVAQQVGPHQVARYAHLAGINSTLDENLSLALGSSAVSPLEMANAYATLARGGQYTDALMVRKIVARDGRVLEEFKQRHEQVFNQEPVAELVDALQDVVKKGTGTGARLFDRPVAGKTGTADGAKDVWFVGFTPDVATAVWGGNDDNKRVAGHVSGGSVMAGIWHNYMAAYYSQHNIPAGEFAQPQHPLMEDPEPLQIWPAPSNLMNQLFGGFSQPPSGPVIREYDWRPKRPRLEYAQPGEPYAKPRKRGLLKKLFGWFNF